jgi:hypothetical protein
VTDFDAVHARLREIILTNRGGLAVTKDGPGGVAIEIPGLEGKPWGYVAGTRVGKSYVSYYLMPLYATPELAATLSPELRKRKQGKACLNFTKVDETLFAELDDLTARAIPGWVPIAEANAAGRLRHQVGRSAG